MSVIAFFLATSFDSNTRSGESQLLANQLVRLHENLRALADDNAWWDDAVENIHIREDHNWMDATIGETVTGFQNIDGTFILRSDNSLVYRHDKLATAPDIPSMLTNGLGTAITRLVPGDTDLPVSNSGYLLSQGDLYVLAVSMIQPTGNRVFEPTLGNSRRPVLVFFQKIDDEQAGEIGAEIGLENLRFSVGNSSFPGISGLSNIVQQPIGRFEWTAQTPGSDVLYKLIWPAVLFLSIIGLAMASFISRAKALMEELEQASRAKMAFLASMSHEVRTPLNAIIGFAEIIRLELPETKDNEESRQHLDIIRSSGEHLLTVINDILNISKLDAEKMEVFPEAMDPVEVIAESVRMMEGAAQSKSVRLVDELESSMIHSDERIIRQVLLNLLSNAIKFTPPEGQVSIRSEIIDNGYKIVVSDTGSGMTKEEIALALEPFGQVKAGGQQEAGTGLGLPLVKRFVGLLGGDLIIRSAPGHGTSVTLELPEAIPARKNSRQSGKKPELL